MSWREKLLALYSEDELRAKGLMGAPLASRHSLLSTNTTPSVTDEPAALLVSW